MSEKVSAASRPTSSPQTVTLKLKSRDFRLRHAARAQSFERRPTRARSCHGRELLAARA